MTWNYRVIVHMQEDDTLFEIYEVYYDINNNPVSYTKNSVGPWGLNSKELKKSLQRMVKCLDKPFLWGDEKFPQIFSEKK